MVESIERIPKILMYSLFLKRGDSGCMSNMQWKFVPNSLVHDHRSPYLVLAIVCGTFRKPAPSDRSEQFGT